MDSSQQADYLAAKAIAERMGRKLGKGWETFEASARFHVDVDCWPAWDLFQNDVSGQWRLNAAGGIIDLDATAVLPMLSLVTDDKDTQRQLWRDLRQIVQGVKRAINKE